MQVGVNVTCMHTNFGGCSFSNFGDIATFKNAKFPFPSMVIKKFNRSESAQKFHASRDSCHMHACQFWWVWLLRFRRYYYFQKRPNFLYSPWSSKNLIDRNRLKKFMQVGVNETCMYTNFGGCGFFTFGDITTFINDQISFSGHGL